MLGRILLILFFCLSGALSALLGPCKKEDTECLIKSIMKVHPILNRGIPSMGVEDIDPMFQDVIEGDLAILQYKLFNTTVRGFRNCALKNFKLNVDALTLSYELDCPSISLNGFYEGSGKLIILDVSGHGAYNVVTGRYLIPVNMEFKVIKLKGRSYLSIKNFKIKPEALGPIKFEFQNLFNGQKDLSDIVHKYAHENWKQVIEFLQEPLFTKNVKTMLRNYNKFLKHEPLNEILIN